MSTFTLPDGKALYYEIHGEGEPVVMLHGWASSHTVYNEAAALLSEKAQCILYDHRGHMNSKAAAVPDIDLTVLADDLEAFLAGLGRGQVTLLGWSMGTSCALRYVERYGCGRLRRLILCDCSPKIRSADDWEYGVTLGYNGSHDLRKMNAEEFYLLFCAFVKCTKPELARKKPALLEHYLEEKHRSCDWEALRLLAISLLTSDFRPCIAQITVPTAYIYADPGSLFSPRVKDWYAAQGLPSFRSIGIGNSTHDFLREHPDAFADAVCEILNKI